jgi:hypothetical protein
MDGYLLLRMVDLKLPRHGILVAMRLLLAMVAAGRRSTARERAAGVPSSRRGAGSTVMHSDIAAADQ